MKALLGTIFLSALVLIGPVRAGTGTPVKDDSRTDFYAALADHFRLPDSVVLAIHERRIPDEELAVVFFLAKQAAVQPEDVTDLRLLRKSWMELASHFGLTAEMFYVSVTANPAPPFAKAYALYKAQPRTLWKRVTLDDADIINLVNLRFVSTFFKVPSDEVIRLRSQNKSFVAIVKEITRPEYKAKMNVTEKAVRPHLREPKKKDQ